jgi:hypothetical protein
MHAMEIALIISLIALAVALPGCIADSLSVIERIRSRRANRAILKKSESQHALSNNLNLLRMLLLSPRQAFLKKSIWPVENFEQVNVNL